MPQNPSWRWLPSRPSAPQLAHDAAASKAQSRPCLPVVEPLGDRIMLSADVEVITDNPDQTPKLAIDQILIGMIKGELQETPTELSLLKIVAEADPKLANKFTAGLLKIDDVLYKVTEDLIKGELGDIKIKKAIADVQSEFLKIDALIGGLGELGDIKIVLDNMENKATELLEVLLKIEPVNELSDKERQLFLKITDTFGDLDAGLLKLQEDVLARAATGKHISKGQLQYLQVKFEDILVSSRQVTDGELKEQLLGTVADYEKILIGLLLPAVDDKDVITVE
jgi:hypothetical protein